MKNVEPKYFQVIETLGTSQEGKLVVMSSVASIFRYKPYGAKLSGDTIGVGFFWTGNTGSRTTGKEYAEQYNRARHYSSLVHQWISRDPLWPQQRAYGYVGGNPIRFVDPLGMNPTAIVFLPPELGGPCPPVGWKYFNFPCPPAPPKPPSRPGLPWPFDNPGKPPIDPPAPEPNYDPYNPIHLPPNMAKFEYGSYCGADNKRDPSLQTVPQDAVDNCCRKHDRCLEANFYAGASELDGHICCDATLVGCVVAVLLTGACGERWDPALNKGKFEECERAANLIAIGMLVPVPALTKLAEKCAPFRDRKPFPCLASADHDGVADEAWDVKRAP